MEKWILSSTVPRQVDPLGVISRLQHDLSISPHHSDSSLSSVAFGARDPNMLARIAGTGRAPHICIVGAGVAGLRCADVLLQHGVRVTILEARNRIGGRICQAKVDGHLVDLGANWIHGSNHNPILDLAEATKTTTHSWDGRQALFDKFGKPMDEAKGAALSERVWEVIGEAMAESNKSSATIPPEKSLWDYFKEKSKDLGDDADTFMDLTEMWGAFVGSPVQRQSLKFFWLEECIDGENLFVAETYHKILERIAGPALKGANILLNKRVTKFISRNADAGSEDTPVRLETSDNETLEFDQVVVTTPLGWLKRNGQAFNPPLPTRLTEAIDSISYGTLDKVYISFKTGWWDKPVPQTNPSHQPNTAPSLSSQSTPNTTATTAPLHQSSASATENQHEHYPGFIQFAPPTFAPDTNPQGWGQECVNLAFLPPAHAHPTLLFYTFGPTSLHLASLYNTTPPPSAASLQKSLIDFFHPYICRLPNYDPTNPDCTPTDVLHTNWANDELAGHGSYGNFQVGLTRADEDIEVMREGMPEKGIWLAGEHTAPFVAVGTVTGAYWAGEGVARRIVRRYGDAK